MKHSEILEAAKKHLWDGVNVPRYIPEEISEYICNAIGFTQAGWEKTEELRAEVIKRIGGYETVKIWFSKKSTMLKTAKEWQDLRLDLINEMIVDYQAKGM